MCIFNHKLSNYIKYFPRGAVGNTLLVVQSFLDSNIIKLRGTPKAFTYQPTAERQAVARVMTSGMVKTVKDV